MLAAGLGYNYFPALVMTSLIGAVALFLVCALLDRLLLQAEGSLWEGPCETQQRYRQNDSERSEAGVGWGAVVSVLGSLGALMTLVHYVIHLINKFQCPQEGEECEGKWKDCREPGKKTGARRSTACRSQALARSPAQCKPCPSASSQTEQAYARQLACMEQRLEGLLYEVQSQRSTLKDTPTGEECLPDTEASDKMRITVYEIADCEASGKTQSRRRTRQLK